MYPFYCLIWSHNRFLQQLRFLRCSLKSQCCSLQLAVISLLHRHFLHRFMLCQMNQYSMLLPIRWAGWFWGSRSGASGALRSFMKSQTDEIAAGNAEKRGKNMFAPEKRSPRFSRGFAGYLFGARRKSLDHLTVGNKSPSRWQQIVNNFTIMITTHSTNCTVKQSPTQVLDSVHFQRTFQNILENLIDMLQQEVCIQTLYYIQDML